MAFRTRSKLEWDEVQDKLILGDLRRFRGRAIGRRIRELMSLGLEAERQGLRVVEQDGLWSLHRLQPVAPSQSASVLTHGTGLAPSEACMAARGLDAEHEAGLEQLLEGLGIDFG